MKRGSINNFTGRISINWDCPRQLRLYGYPRFNQGSSINFIQNQFSCSDTLSTERVSLLFDPMA